MSALGAVIWSLNFKSDDYSFLMDDVDLLIFHCELVMRSRASIVLRTPRACCKLLILQKHVDQNILRKFYFNIILPTVPGSNLINYEL